MSQLQLYIVQPKVFSVFQNVKIYSVQCLNRRGSDHFYGELARITDGKHLHLDQFQNVVDMLMAICYGENLGEK